MVLVDSDGAARVWCPESVLRTFCAGVGGADFAASSGAASDWRIREERIAAPSEAWWWLEVHPDRDARLLQLVRGSRDASQRRRRRVVAAEDVLSACR